MAEAIQIRGAPEDVHGTFHSRAALAGVSLSDYLLGEIARVAPRPPIADVLARASQRGGSADLARVVEAVRAGRDLD